MNWKEIKARIKSIPLIGNTYNLLYGNRKTARIIQKKRELLHSEGYDLAGRIDDALTNRNVLFYLDYGSLLGIVRSGRFIGHDYDMDYSIYITEDFGWNDLEKVMLGLGLKIAHQFRLNGVITEQTYAFGALTVDFFGHFDDDKNSIAYLYYKKKNKVYHSVCEWNVAEIRAKKIAGTKRIKADGRIYTVPDEAEEYLASIYTDNWRVPNPNWESDKGPAWNDREDLIGIYDECKREE